MKTSGLLAKEGSVSLGDLKHRSKLLPGRLQSLTDEGLLPAGFETEIEPVLVSVDKFKLSVPLVGKFTTGKSSLLNAWLQHDMQAVDLARCTSYPTEFHYATRPCMVVHRRRTDGSTPAEQCFVEDDVALREGRLGSTDDVQLVQIHVDDSALARPPDIIVANTPGISAAARHHEDPIAPKRVAAGVPEE